MELPEKIKALAADGVYRQDGVGMSGSSVRIYADKVLKVQECGEEAENEYRMLRYLRGKLPVPQVYARELWQGRDYLLMGRCPGRMACDGEYMRSPKVQCRMLAEGLKRLWSVDISDCPSDQRLEHKLARARHNVENGLVDMDDAEPETFGENGFRNPEQLLRWLCDNAPREEAVLSHGDYCLPNVFGEGEEPTGYIDLGRAGIADKWCDIALCYRSLSHNFSGKYSRAVRGRREAVGGEREAVGGRRKASGEDRPGKEGEDFDAMLLFQELGVVPDWEKIRYYILLDELF